ncbi:uncharacterized protein DFL_005426 [Arthrobotrys flagrans]|uniref:Uncharacterized protein n=1 Tax=Arthrobotrys flagrans TaxID=97331 RepID=A0A436ZY23_ARTFL|nr:hypothetical protein DFL_005426 [Arthrobotrys flagrans]
MASIMERQGGSTTITPTPSSSSSSSSTSSSSNIQSLSLQPTINSVTAATGIQIRKDGSSRFILVDDAASAATFDLTLRQSISVDSHNSITFASTTHIIAPLDPWEVSPDAGDISVEFVIDSGTDAVIWSHPIFSNMLNFHPAPCLEASGTITAVDWIYNPSSVGTCSRFVLQATGGDLSAATATPSLTSIVPTGAQTVVLPPRLSIPLPSPASPRPPRWPPSLRAIAGDLAANGPRLPPRPARLCTPSHAPLPSLSQFLSLRLLDLDLLGSWPSVCFRPRWLLPLLTAAW